MLLRQWGFLNVHRGLELSDEVFDLYYFDGLQGRCFALMALLPRHKCVVKSGSSEIVERALKDGYIAVYA